MSNVVWRLARVESGPLHPSIRGVSLRFVTNVFDVGFSVKGMHATHAVFVHLKPPLGRLLNCDVIFTTQCTLLTAALFLLRKRLPIALFLPRAQVEVVPHLALIPMLWNPLHLPVIVT